MAGDGPRPSRLRPIFLVSQVSLSVLLLVTAGLFVRSFYNAQGADPGFDASHVLVASIDLETRGYTEARGRDFVVIEGQADIVRKAESDGARVVQGDALDPQVLAAAGIADAEKLLIAIPEGYEAGAILEHARALNPAIRVIARAHSDAEVAHLHGCGTVDVVMGERETAARMIALALAGREAGTAA